MLTLRRDRHEVVLCPEIGGSIAGFRSETDGREVDWLDEPPRAILRGGAGARPAAGRVTRVPPGHSEGYLEGFANIYNDIAEVVTARLEGHDPDPGACGLATIEDGVRGVEFIEAAVESRARRRLGRRAAFDLVWIEPRLPSAGLCGPRALGLRVQGPRFSQSAITRR